MLRLWYYLPSTWVEQCQKCVSRSTLLVQKQNNTKVNFTKQSTANQPTNPTHPFILLLKVNKYFHLGGIIFLSLCVCVYIWMVECTHMCVCININMNIVEIIWKVLCFKSGRHIRKNCHAFLVLDDTINYFLLLVYLPCYKDYARSKLLKYVLVKHAIVIVQVIHNSNVIASTVPSRFWDNWPYKMIFLETFYMKNYHVKM